MSSPSATTMWARAFVDELARCGVRDVVVAPGSRSTPLVLAFATDGRFRMRVHLDERSAGFFALGVGRVTGMPAVVVTTSGTATANLFPAVMEASQADVPLLVLTADRPHRLRDADANQAVDQVRLYGSFARAFFDAAPPSLEGAALRHLRGLAARAVSAAREAPAGPVQVNFPFDKPLEPVADGPDAPGFAAEHPLAAGGRPDGRAFVEVTAAAAVPTDAQLAHVAELLSGARRAVLVAGPCTEPGRTGEALVALAAATGLPLLADPLSGARFRPAGEALLVNGYDLFFRDGEVRDRLAPDLIVRVGASPTSTALQGWMEHHNGVRHLVVDAGGRWKDHGAIATDYLRADAAGTLRALAGRVPYSGDASWRRDWKAASTAMEVALAEQEAAHGHAGHDHAGHNHEGRVLAQVVDGLPDGASLFVSSSMPIRDLDAFAHGGERQLHVWANRGASGIDGIVSSAFGVASVSDGPTACVLGDVAFFHDQNGLLWSREEDASVVFVLIDNDGGGIFHMLPVREHEPHFTRFFATPHGLDFEHPARMHGVPFQDVKGSDLPEALAGALDAGGTHVIRVRTDRAEGQARRRAIVDAVARSVRDALG